MNGNLVYTFQRNISESHLEFYKNMLQDFSILQSLKIFGSKFVVIADEQVARIYDNYLHACFWGSGLEVILLTFPAGEHSKTREMKSYLEDQMLEKGCGRDTHLIAFGGGVTLDLGGYIASTYCRGIPLVYIPTTLLAMVDACMGGKNGVNTLYGKNMLGSFYQPKKILIDSTFLNTLPVDELRNGFVEMIKHAVIVDRAHFEYLEYHVERLLALDHLYLEKAIFDSCAIKKAIVEEDEKEQGKRRILNFGHTVAHALETLTSYQLPHGEAVAIGMLVESHIAMQLGSLNQNSLERLHTLLVCYGLPLKLPMLIDVQQLIQMMVLDKKSQAKQPRFVILEEIGQVKENEGQYCAAVDITILTKALNWMIHDLCRC